MRLSRSRRRRIPTKPFDLCFPHPARCGRAGISGNELRPRAVENTRGCPASRCALPMDCFAAAGYRLRGSSVWHTAMERSFFFVLRRGSRRLDLCRWKSLAPIRRRIRLTSGVCGETRSPRNAVRGPEEISERRASRRRTGRFLPSYRCFVRCGRADSRDLAGSFASAGRHGGVWGCCSLFSNARERRVWVNDGSIWKSNDPGS